MRRVLICSSILFLLAAPALAADPYVDAGFAPATPRPDPDLVVVRELFYGAGGVDLTDYGLGGPHAYVQSVYFRLFVDNNASTVDSFTGLVIFPAEITILGFIRDQSPLGGELDDGLWTQSDTVFGIGSDPDAYSETARGFETGGGVATSEFIGQISDHSFVFGLNVDGGMDDFRVIIDYGDAFGDELSFDILAYDVGSLGGAEPTEGIRVGDETNPVVFGSGDFGEFPSLLEVPLTSTTPPIPADALPFEPLASLFMLRDPGSAARVDAYDTGRDVPIPDMFTIATGLGNPRGITDGNDGLLYATGRGGGFATFHPWLGTSTIDTTDDLGGNNQDITNLAGRDELFVVRGNGASSRIDLVDASVPEVTVSHALPAAQTDPVAVTDGPDGLLYVIATGGTLAWMDADGGSVDHVVLAPASGTYEDVTGRPGSDLLYLLRDTTGDTAIDTYDTGTGAMVYDWVTFAAPGTPVGITDGPDDHLYVLGAGTGGPAGYMELDAATGAQVLYHAFMDFLGPNLGLTNLAVHPTVAVDDGAPPAPAIRHLAAPNPFNAGVEIRFASPRPAPARVDVFDARGRFVRELDVEKRGDGLSSAHWNGRDDSGREMPSGTYLYRVRAGELGANGKLQLAR